MELLILLAVCALCVAAMAVLDPFPLHRRMDALSLAVASVLFLALGALTLVVNPAMSGFVVSLATAGIVLVTAILMVRRRRLYWHARLVLDPLERSRGLESLRAHLAKKRALQRSQDARRAASILAQHGLFDEAVTILADQPVTDIPARWKLERAVHANDLAGYRIRMGDLAGARDALASIEHRHTSMVPILAAKEALLSALEGAPDEALAILTRAPLPPKSPHRVVASLARAHAHAARGDDHAATEALRALATLDPKGWVKRATTPPGPATALAVRLAAELGAPYR
jgi:hypothetical protein